MEIKIKETDNKVTFGTLSFGTVFIWRDVPFLKVAESCGISTTSINLHTNKITPFLLGTKVEPKTSSVLEVK